MAANCKIEWVAELARQRDMTSRSWNPVFGCSRASEGCRNCYAAGIAARFGGAGNGVFAGLTERDGDGTPRFNGKIDFSEKRLMEPLKWRKPAVVFVGDMADLFHQNVTDEMLDRIFAVMALRPDCLFLVLTKRPERMREYCTSRNGMGNAAICTAINAIPAHLGNRHGALEMPLPNVWLGVTTEDQPAADARIPHLLATPAVKRFVSVEPMLGLVDLTRWLELGGLDTDLGLSNPGLDLVICGGESGPGARLMHRGWARGLRDQCAAAKVPFFFKQWGEWGIHTPSPRGNLTRDVRAGRVRVVHLTGQADTDETVSAGGNNMLPTSLCMFRFGKKAAGRLLDGREWNEVPK